MCVHQARTDLSTEVCLPAPHFSEILAIKLEARRVHALLLSLPQLFETPWTVAGQAPLSVGFSRQEYWSRLPFPTPGDLPELRIELASPLPFALTGEFVTTA